MSKPPSFLPSFLPTYPHFSPGLTPPRRVASLPPSLPLAMGVSLQAGQKPLSLSRSVSPLHSRSSRPSNFPLVEITAAAASLLHLQTRRPRRAEGRRAEKGPTVGWTDGRIHRFERPQQSRVPNLSSSTHEFKSDTLALSTLIEPGFRKGRLSAPGLLREGSR